MSRAIGAPPKRWKTMRRTDLSIESHDTKMEMYKWIEDNNLTIDDLHILCDEGYGNGWDVVKVQRRYYQMG